jgi:hypothetical protein
MLTIWYGGIKSKPSDINELFKLSNVYLGKVHMATLPTIPRHSVMKNQPLVEKLHFASQNKTLDLDILQKTVLWEME